METLMAMIDWLVAAAAWTIRNSLESCLLIGVIAAFYLVGRRTIAPRLLTVLWILIGIRLMLPVSPESRFSVFNWMPDGRREAPEVRPAEFLVDPFLEPEPVRSMESQEAAPLEPSLFGAEMIWAGLWGLGVAGILGFVFLRQIATRRMVRDLPGVRDPFLRDALETCKRRAGVRCRLRLVESPSAGGIAVFGGFRPTHIILPSDFASRYSEAEIHGIFLHELAHVRRGDLTWNWVTVVIQAIHWFNPLVWWAGGRFLADRESDCDRFVLSRLPAERHRDYGNALLKTLEFRLRFAAPQPALVPFSSRKSELKHRLQMIKKTKSNPVVQAAVGLLCLAACAMTFTSALTQEREGEGRRSPESEREGPRDAEEGIGRSTEEDRDLMVDVLADGVFIGDEKISLVNLRGKLEGVRASGAILSVGPNVPFQNVNTVMNALRNSGIRDVRIRVVGDDSAELRADRIIPVGEGRRDGEGERRTGPRDGEGERRTGPRDGEGERRTGPRDGEGERRTGPRDGEGERRTGPRDGEGERRTGPRDGEGERRTGPRDGEGERRMGPRDGEGERRTGPRDGEGERRTGARDGEGERRSRGEETAEMDTRKLNQLTRIYRTYDKNSDNAVTFEEWVAMKNYELTSEQREREQGWFNQADANGDGKMTLGEWIDWKSSQGSGGDR